MSENKKHDKGKRHDKNLAPSVGIERESSRMTTYVSGWGRSRKRTLSPKRGDTEED